MLTRRIVRSAGLDARAPHESEVLWQLGESLLGDAAIPRDPRLLRPLILEEDVARSNRVAFQISDKWERLGIAFDHVVRALQLVSQTYPTTAIAPENEADYAERVGQAAGVPVERYEQLEPWKRAIGSAAALVAPDSGALHLAGMLGTPTVAVFPPIREFKLQSARWSPWAAPYRALRADADWPEATVTALEALRTV